MDTILVKPMQKYMNYLTLDRLKRVLLGNSLYIFPKRVRILEIFTYFCEANYRFAKFASC